MDCYAGFDIGGTDLKFGIVRSDGTLLCQTKIPTPYGQADRLTDAMCDLVIAHRDKYPVAAIGIGCTGYADKKAGILRQVDNLGMPEIRFREKLEERLHLPVRVDNDVQVALIAEHRQGAGQNARDLIYVALGTGVGGAFLLDGRFYRGHANGGGEIGHLVIRAGGRLCSCGMRGCLEQYASVAALIKDVKKAYRKQGRLEQAEIVDGKSIFAALRANDALTWSVYAKFLDYLSVGLISLMSLFEPEKIIIGGAFSNEGDYFAGHVTGALMKLDTYPQYYANIKVEMARLGNQAGMIGAGLMFSESNS